MLNAAPPVLCAKRDDGANEVHDLLEVNVFLSVGHRSSTFHPRNRSLKSSTSSSEKVSSARTCSRVHKGFGGSEHRGALGPLWVFCLLLFGEVFPVDLVIDLPHEFEKVRKVQAVVAVGSDFVKDHPHELSPPAVMKLMSARRELLLRVVLAVA